MPRSLRAPQITLQEMFLHSALKHPEKPAAVFEGKSLSYKELQDKIENLAAHLQSACGVKRGDRVLLDMQNGHDFVIACFAILRADAVVVPVSPMNLAQELRHCIHDNVAGACAWKHIDGNTVALAAARRCPRRSRRSSSTCAGCATSKVTG